MDMLASRRVSQTPTPRLAIISRLAALPITVEGRHARRMDEGQLSARYSDSYARLALAHHVAREEAAPLIGSRHHCPPV